MRRAAAACVVACLLAAVIVAGATGADGRSFRTPSGNIGCLVFEGTLRCDIGTGLKPRPPRPAGCELDWGFGLTLGRIGRAGIVCAGDTVIDPRAPLLGYGSVWRRAGITCTSRASGLTCLNRAARGFLLSRDRWRRLS